MLIAQLPFRIKLARLVISMLFWIHAAATFLAAIVLQRSSGFAGTSPFMQQLGPAPANPRDDSCEKLNRLEEAALAMPTGPEFEEYRKALAAWRKAHPGYQPSCRTDALGKQLCKDGAKLAALLGPATGDEWDSWMRELIVHETTPDDCANFAARQVVEMWPPHVWHWPQQTSEVILDELLGDADYASYADALHLAPPFGAPQVKFRHRPQGRFQMHRVEQLNHWRVLRKAVPGLELSQLEQVVEFGGGTGNLPATFFDLGYTGVHFVYDFPTMILMQRYWLHYSGVPAVLGTDLPKGIVRSGRTMGIVLESSLSDDLANHLDTSKLQDALFVATYSFTEADFESRAKIWRIVKKFGVIQLAFWADFYGKDNMRHIEELVETDLRPSHWVAWWTMPPGWHATPGIAYYLVAVRKDRGNVRRLRCAEELGCTSSTAHTLLLPET
ncbi:unnamed protein product [Symbiodinium sp. CCMP2592]|nr:unnamed protein product [Symbiodinium sp. CCMP2592]